MFGGSKLVVVLRVVQARGQEFEIRGRRGKTYKKSSVD
jgi:hypothetical protein